MVGDETTVIDEESLKLLESDNEDEKEARSERSLVFPTSRPNLNVFEEAPDPSCDVMLKEEESLRQETMKFSYQDIQVDEAKVKHNVNRGLFWTGPQKPLPSKDALKDVQSRKVVNEGAVIDVGESSDDDSDVEMVAVVTNDKRSFKPIKVEEEEDVKKRTSWPVHFTKENATQYKISSRIRAFYEMKRQEIMSKKPLIAPQFMKGTLENSKFKHLKRTIEPCDENSELGSSQKVAKVRDNLQVEVTNLPTDWVQEGVAKIASIANAYGQDGEKATEKVFLKGQDCFVIIFKKESFAQRMYETLNQRQIDEFVIQVSVPHPVI